MSQYKQSVRDLWRNSFQDMRDVLDQNSQIWSNAFQDTRDILRDRQTERVSAREQRRLDRQQRMAERVDSFKQGFSDRVNKVKGYANVLNLKNLFNKREQTPKPSRPIGTTQFKLTAAEQEKLSRLFASNDIVMDKPEYAKLHGERSADGSNHILSTIDENNPNPIGRDFSFSFTEDAEAGTYTGRSSEYLDGNLVNNKDLDMNNMYARMAYGSRYDKMANNFDIHDDMSLKDFLDSKDQITTRRGKQALVINEKDLLTAFAESNGYDVTEDTLGRVSDYDGAYRFGFKAGGRDVMFNVDKETGRTSAAEYDESGIVNERFVDSDQFFARGILGKEYDSVLEPQQEEELSVMAIQDLFQSEQHRDVKDRNKLTNDGANHVRQLLKNNGFDYEPDAENRVSFEAYGDNPDGFDDEYYSVRVEVDNGLGDEDIHNTLRLDVNKKTGKTEITELEHYDRDFNDPTFAFSGKAREGASDLDNVDIKDMIDNQWTIDDNENLDESGRAQFEEMLRARGYEGPVESVGLGTLENGNQVLTVASFNEDTGLMGGVQVFVRPDGSTYSTVMQQLAQDVDLNAGVNKSQVKEFVQSESESDLEHYDAENDEHTLREINQILNDPNLDSATALEQVRQMVNQQVNEHTQEQEQVQEQETYMEEDVVLDGSDFDADLDLDNEIEHVVSDVAVPHFDNKTAQDEHNHRRENNLSRLFVAREQKLADDKHGNPRYALAISHANDIDINHDPSDPTDAKYHTLRVEEYNEDPMLVSNPLKNNPNAKQHFSIYTQGERDAIMNNSENGVFLAKTDSIFRFAPKEGSIVDVSSIEKSEIPFDRDKHMTNTKEYRRDLEVAQEMAQDVATESEHELSM